MKGNILSFICVSFCNGQRFRIWIGLLVFLNVSFSSSAQTVIPVDLSAQKEMSVTLNNVVRGNNVCGAPNNNTCVEFVVTLHPQAELISITYSKSPNAAGYYINCAGPYAIGVPICLPGQSVVTIAFCKPGNESVSDYTITTSSPVKGSADLNLRENCSGTMSVTGLQQSSVTWTSIFPGSLGQYSGTDYLSCNSNCTVTTVTPPQGAPAYIDYRVSGTSSACPTAKADTIRVYTSPALTVNIAPANPAICSNTPVTLTASPSGGSPPYSYSWSPGPEVVSTKTVVTAGTYTVTVSDGIAACPAVSKGVTVAAIATPAAPTANGVTICAGNSAVLTTTTVAGGSYRWYDAASGGNLLSSSASYTTPALNTTTDYYVDVTVSGCTSSRTKVTVTVNPIPAAPTVSGATICAGNTTTLNATAPGGAYEWYNAAAGGTMLGSGTNFLTPVLSSSADYYIQTTVNGCTSSRTRVTVTVNPIPAAPTAAAALICANGSTTLTATAPGGSYRWFDVGSGGSALGTGTSFVTPVLTATTNYYVETTVSACTSARTTVTVTVTSTPPAPTVSDAGICTGTSATLTATAPGGNYSWFTQATGGAVAGTGTVYSTPVLTATTTYYVETAVAGCASSGRTPVTVTVSPIPATPTAAGAAICSGNSATLTATAPGGTYQWFDASSGGTLLATATSYSTPVLTSSANYYLQTTVNGCTSSRTPVAATVTALPAAPTVANALICAGTAATLSATGPGGTYQWFDVASGGSSLFTGSNFTGPVLTSSTTYYAQTTVSGCTGARTAVSVTVTPKPAAPTVAPQTICAGNNATLNATAPGGNYRWYDAASGGSLLFAGDSYSTPVLSSTANFYVETSVSGCTGPRSVATVSVTALPSAPTAAAGATCEGTGVLLTATAPGGTYQWYDAATGGTVLGGGSSYSSGVLNSNTTFYVSATVNGCTGSRTAVPVTVTPIPVVPTVSGVSVCAGTNAVLSASAPGGTYQWYDNAIGGVILHTGASFSTPVLTASTSYYVQSTINGCTGNRTAVTVNVTPLPAAPSATGNTLCTGNATIFNATAPGGIYQWYDANTGGNLLTTSSSFSTPVLNASTTYYVQAIVLGCAGPRTAVVANVVPKPAAPTVAAPTICEDNQTTLTATGPGGIYEWYDAAIGGNLLATAAVLTTPVLTQNTSYFVQSSVSGCTSARAVVTVTVTPKIIPSFQYTSGTVCISGGNPTPVISGALVGTFSSTPGLVFINNSTGQINVAASTPGTYTVTFVTGGSCVYSSSARITITNSPNASFSYNGPYCQQTPAVLPNFPTGASAGVFSASPAGLVFVSPSTGEIDLAKSTPGTYTLTNQIAAQGGCVAASASSNVTINPQAMVNAGIDQIICAGNTVQLSGSYGGSATKATWSGGSGSFSNNAQLNTVYTPAPGETSAKLYLTTDDPPGPCAAGIDSVTIFITPIPPAPVVSGNAVCTGNAATLTAIAPGGVYEWYDAATAGNLLATSNIYTTPVLSGAATFYVRSIMNGCAGIRASVAVSVGARPTINSPGTGAVCTGAPLQYDIVGNQPGVSYSWVRGAVPGISNVPSTGFTDGRIVETLNNTTGSPVAVTYLITPTNSNCVGSVFSYIVTVRPKPATPVIASSSPVCVGSTLSFSTAAVSGGTYTWAGPDNFSSSEQNPVISKITLASAGVYSVTVTVNGCSSLAASKNIFPVIAAPTAASNAPVCEGGRVNLTASNLAGASYQWTGPGGFSSSLQNPAILSSQQSHAGTYYVTASLAGCPGLTDSVKVSISRPPTAPQVFSNSPVCSRDSVTLTATSVQGASYQWTGPNGFSSNVQSPVIQKASTDNTGSYTVIASTPGCGITAVTSVPVTVKITPGVPGIGSNSPVCEGADLKLFSNSVPGASFKWMAETGFISGTQNPIINNVSSTHAGTYYVVATINGCTGDTARAQVSIVKPTVASAGNATTVCANNASVQLDGRISGEDTQTAAWTTDGTGIFLPAVTALSAKYIPGSADTAMGSVRLTLFTTNNKVCPVSSSSVLVTITDAPTVNAGPDHFVCSNDSLIRLQGFVNNATGGEWRSLGSGSFTRQNTQLNNVYVPSRQDIQQGSVRFYLLSTGNGSCLGVADTLRMAITAAPRVYAGADRTIFEKENAVLSPVVTGSSLQYLWLPNSNLNDNTLKNPVITGKDNITYTLRVIGEGGCESSDDIFIKVLKPIIIPNIFSPNGDGIHDTWDITQIHNYAGATVEVYTRTGQKIFSSVGYARQWDGTFEGKPVPVATYYYIVNPKYSNWLFSGSITVIR